MLGRRTLLRGLAGALLVAPHRAAAQPARGYYRVGVLRPAPTDARFQHDFGGFRDALREGGYALGVNLALEYRMRPGPGRAILGMASAAGPPAGRRHRRDLARGGGRSGEGDADDPDRGGRPRVGSASPPGSSGAWRGRAATSPASSWTSRSWPASGSS